MKPVDQTRVRRGLAVQAGDRPTDRPTNRPTQAAEENSKQHKGRSLLALHTAGVGTIPTHPFGECLNRLNRPHLTEPMSCKNSLARCSAQSILLPARLGMRIHLVFGVIAASTIS